MANLVALDYIKVGFTEYKPGDSLPADNPEQAAEWVGSGAAVWRDDDYTPPVWSRARRAAAMPGMPGTAVGGEATGDNLVGRIPETERRRREWKR